MSQKDDHVWSVIMAGGVGSRFWPLSRRDRPKQVLDLFGDGPMLRVTLERVAAITPPERVLVVTSQALAASVLETLPSLGQQQVLAEPVGRNTAPAVAWAALEVAARDPEGILMVLPADHHIHDVAAYRALCREALAVAAEGWIVTLGISPTHPETGYGYVKRGPGIHGRACRVESFREKPDLETAATYLADGRYLWNSGMFFMPAALAIEELRRHEPELMAMLERAYSDGDVAGVYPALSKISIDYAVMERTSRAAVIPGDFGWSDVGSWRSLMDFKESTEPSFTRGDVHAIDSERNVLFAEGGSIAVVGIEGLVVVHTPKATLVCPVDESQRVRELVDRLTEHQRGELL